MKRWDGMADGYIKQCETRGQSEGTVIGLRNELDRFGCWLKRRRPKPNLEEVDGLMLIEYIRRRTRFHAKTTVAGVTSKIRLMGEYLVQEGVWNKNPMRWIKGPRLDPRGRMPKRIGQEHLKKIWEASRQNPNRYQQHLSIAVLALLYGTGLRRGELERLDLEHWKREEGILKIDGRTPGRIPKPNRRGICPASSTTTTAPSTSPRLSRKLVIVVGDGKFACSITTTCWRCGARTTTFLPDCQTCSTSSRRTKLLPVPAPPRKSETALVEWSSASSARRCSSSNFGFAVWDLAAQYDYISKHKLMLQKLGIKE